MLEDVSAEDALAARRRAMSLLARALASELRVLSRKAGPITAPGI